MEIREFFYWTASIALILIGLFTLSLFVALFYIKRLADRTSAKILARVELMSDQVSGASRAWRNLTITRFIIRALRLIF
jgi:hypothetical protein